ncbi:MAG: GntR family transcriptional regulator [Lachnospiraceae bacterium]|nr:GntR family transcriptional regulator [Lachnospiraceae bacterium]
MEALFSAINVKSVKESFVDDLLHKIISGELTPGDRLPPEREIAAETGISRSIVNQGLLQLESMGFVEIKPRHGTVVADFMKYPTAQSIDALMRYGSSDIDARLLINMVDFRILIEKESAKLACVNAYESTLDKMEELLDAMTVSPKESAEAQYQFHYRLTQASGNYFYSVIFRGFETIIKVLIEKHYELCPQDLKTASKAHKKLLDAIRNKDEEQAQELIEKILVRGREILGDK